MNKEIPELKQIFMEELEELEDSLDIGNWSGDLDVLVDKVGEYFTIYENIIHNKIGEDELFYLNYD